MTEPRERSTRWLWIAAIWLAGGLFDASQNVLIMRAEGRRHSWLPLFGTELAIWLPWALATPFISRLARRHRFVRGQMLRTAGVHLAVFVTLSAVTEAWSATLQVMFNPWGNRRPPQFVDTWSTSLLYQALTFLIVYALILTATLVLESRERMARQLTETARLNEELSKAQLAALRRQIEPHFMFNTLHAIAGLVRDHRNEAAVSMIVGLSEFLRRATDDSQRAQVTLAEEVEYLRRYVDIQKVRFGERLRVDVDIPAELLRAQVPHLLLQPLVENAIKHGISQRVAGGRVRVAGTAEQGNLRLTVYNDGPHSDVTRDAQANHTGVGIGNLRTRLRILHGDRSALQLRPVAAGGVEVVVTLPLQEA
ncbi:MAG TPA: histidine kinase [Steroidobacteraceae bacterium]|jgi:two-component system LytT family sensor kinase|nr:histidine kinase [Steroidobacteraceae bacterium]